MPSGVWPNVLILIVMDDPLRDFLRPYKSLKEEVLILIVMDDPLRVLNGLALILVSAGLNPYCNG